MGRTKPSATRKRVGINYIQPAAATNPTSTTMVSVVGASTPSRKAAALFSLAASPVATTASAPQDCEQRPSSLPFELFETPAIPGLSAIEPPQIESECMLDVATPDAAAVHDAEEKATTTRETLALETPALDAGTASGLTSAQQRQSHEDESVAESSHSNSGSDAASSSSPAETEEDARTALLSSSRPQTPPLAALQQPTYGAQQQSTPIGTAAPRPPQERMVTISVSELERWQQRVVSHIEAHFSNEQLKRIAEFGRAHASLLVEAKEYVYNIETQLSAQFDKERADIRAQAEAFVAQPRLENQQLRQMIIELQHEMQMLKVPHRRRNRLIIADDDDEEEEKDMVEVAADVAVENSEDLSSDESSSSSDDSPQVEFLEVKQLRREDSDEQHSRSNGRRRRLLHEGEHVDNQLHKKTRISVSSMVVDRVHDAG